MSVPLPLQTRRNWRYTLASGRWVVVVGLVVLIGLGVALAREVVRRSQVQAQIKQMQTDVSAQQRRNEELQGLIGYFQSGAFRDLEARKELNVQVPGEKVIDVQQPAAVARAIPAPQDQTPRTNLVSWWDYLFGDRT